MLSRRRNATRTSGTYRMISYKRTGPSRLRIRSWRCVRQGCMMYAGITSVVGAECHPNVCNPRMARAQACDRETALPRHLPQSATTGIHPVPTHEYLNEAFWSPDRHRIHLPARPAHHRRRLPVEFAPRAHAHHGRHVRNLRMLRERAGSRAV